MRDEGEWVVRWGVGGGKSWSGDLEEGVWSLGRTPEGARDGINDVSHFFVDRPVRVKEANGLKWKELTGFLRISGIWVQRIGKEMQLPQGGDSKGGIQALLLLAMAND